MSIKSKPSDPTNTPSETPTTPSTNISPPTELPSTPSDPTPTEGTSTHTPANVPPASRSGRTLRPTHKRIENEYAGTADLEDTNYAFTINDDDSEIPNSYQQAIQNPDKAQWTKAIDAELTSLADNETWTEVRRTSEMHVIDTRWVFAKKYNSNDELVRHKARLVAKGFTQIQGIDYDDTSMIGNLRSLEFWRLQSWE